MKVKKRIHLSAGIMLISFIGIVIIQYYWINRAYNSSKVSFNYQVTGAMLDVVRTLEHDEIDEKYKEFHDPQDKNLRPPMRIRIDEYNYSHDQLNTNDNYYKQKSDIAEEIIFDIYNDRNKLIEERIDPIKLDSLISNNLIRRNIKTYCEYAIYHPARDTMIYKNFDGDEKFFFNNASSFKLFPRDKVEYPSYLLVHFPNEEKYIINKNILVFLISVILLVCIIVSYVMIVKKLEYLKMLYDFENEFINNITHEFKTPIATIAIASELLSDPDIIKNQKFFEQHIKTIRDENRRLKEMSEKILTTARISKGILTLQKELVDIHDIIVDLTEKVKVRTEIKDGKIILNLQATDYKIYADRFHICNVISNLLDNAEKYSPKSPLIEISTSSSNNLLQIDVRDNGVGIEKSEFKNIFQRMYRIPAGDVHNFKGYGLGLSYVKSIVDAHKGVIEINSEINVGSTFTVKLPINLE